MAKLPALVSALAETDGRERKSVDHVARLLRDAGFIPRAGRGSAAADMTTWAAVNLILGLYGNFREPIEAPAAVHRFRSLYRKSTSITDETSPFAPVAAKGNFGEAMEVLVEAMWGVLQSSQSILDEGIPDNRIRKRYKEELIRSSWRSPVCLIVTFSSSYQASIEFKVSTGDASSLPSWTIIFSAKYDLDFDKYRDGFYGDLRVDPTAELTITGLTLLKVWTALQGEEGATLELRMA